MKFTDIFIKDWPIKILCLALAFGLWVYVANDGFESRSFDEEIPIKYINLPQGLAVANELSGASVKFRVPSSITQTVKPEDFKIYVDLENLGAGEHELPVKITASETDVKIINIDPKTLKVVLDNRAVERFSINVETYGEVGAGFATAQPKLSADEVEVSGAESVLGSVSKIVAPIELSGEVADIRRVVSLKAYDKSGKEIKVLEFNPKNVEVGISLTKELSLKTLGIKVNTTGSPEEGFLVKSVIAEPSAKVFKGQKDALDELEFIETESVNLAGLIQSGTQEIALKLPAGIESEDGNAKVNVKINLEALETTKKVKAGFSFRNLASGLKVSSFAPQSVEVTFKGKADVLSSLTGDDVHVNIDLSGLNEGNHKAVVDVKNVSVPAGVAAVSVDANEIGVTIAK